MGQSPGSQPHGHPEDGTWFALPWRQQDISAVTIGPAQGDPQGMC